MLQGNRSRAAAAHVVLVLVIVAPMLAMGSESVVTKEALEPRVDVAGVLRLPGGQALKSVPQIASQQPPASLTLHSPSGATYWTVGRSDGTFVFHQVPVGVYQLHVEFAHLVFPMLRVSVLEGRSGALRIRVVVHDAKQTAVQGDGTLEAPFEVVAVGRHQYFVPREEYSILSLVKNPMVIMMLVSVGMMGLTKLIPQDELKQQMKEMNKQVQDSKQQLGLEKKGQ